MKWKIRCRPKRESVLSVCQTEMNLVIPWYFWFCFWIWWKLFWLKRDLLSEQKIGCFDYGKANLKELKIILLFLNYYPHITISYQKPIKILCSWGWIFFCFILSFLIIITNVKVEGQGIIINWITLLSFPMLSLTNLQPTMFSVHKIHKDILEWVYSQCKDASWNT